MWTCGIKIEKPISSPPYAYIAYSSLLFVAMCFLSRMGSTFLLYVEHFPIIIIIHYSLVINCVNKLSNSRDGEHRFCEKLCPLYIIHTYHINITPSDYVPRSNLNFLPHSKWPVVPKVWLKCCFLHFFGNCNNCTYHNFLTKFIVRHKRFRTTN